MKSVLKNRSFHCWKIAVLLLLQSFFSAGQSERVKTKWMIKDPFDFKVFIKNQRQYTLPENITSEEILYAIDNGPLSVFFTRSGIIYRNRSEKEKLFTETFAPMDQDEFQYALMRWQNANADCELIPSEKASYYFTFPDPLEQSEKTTLRAPAFKKLLYKNIYPHTDIEYTFPEDKAGFKYAIILHPGADPSQIKMKYVNAQLSFDGQSNIVIKAPFGDVVDHAPVTFNAVSKLKVPSSFMIEDSCVSFHLEGYDSVQTFIIDPWITSPNLSGNNSAYDMEIDDKSFCYVYGGSKPYREVKIDTLGAIQWVYTSSSLQHTHYGDFAVEFDSGNSYIADGYNTGKIVKLDVNGNQIGMYPGTAGFKNQWRLYYDNCNDQLFIAGAGGTSMCCQAAVLDANMTSMKCINLLGASEQHDAVMLLVDDDAHTYFATGKSSFNPAAFNNMLLKCASDTVVPVQYIIKNNYAFIDQFGMNFGNVSNHTGMNGLSYNNEYLFTYDGKFLQKWDKKTGELYNSTYVSSKEFEWGGIAADYCDDVFVGTDTAIIEYDPFLNLLLSIHTPGKVFDLKKGSGDKIFGCGKGFVSLYEMSEMYCDELPVNYYTFECYQSNISEVWAVRGVSPYSYSWEPGGFSGDSLRNLPEGDYIVIARDASCNTRTDSVKFEIKNAEYHSGWISGPDTMCKGIHKTFYGMGGQKGGSYLWFNGSTDSIYKFIAEETDTLQLYVTTSKGCLDTVIKRVVVLEWPDGSVTGRDSICPGEEVTLTASGAKYFLWQNGKDTSTITVKPKISTNYFVRVSNGWCSDSVPFRVNIIDPNVYITVSGDGVNAQLNASGAFNYTWFPTEGLSCINCPNPLASNLETKEYCVFGTSYEGCQDTTCVTVRLSTIYVPNSFTPDNNNVNDVFKPYVRDVYDYRLMIFNKWGIKLFETTDPEAGWDGSFNGRVCEQDAYVYKISYINMDDLVDYHYSGHVFLIR